MPNVEQDALGCRNQVERNKLLTITPLDTDRVRQRIRHRLQEHIKELPLRSVQPLNLLLQLLAARDDVRRLLQEVLAALEALCACDAQAFQNGVVQGTISIQCEDELVIDRVRDIVREPLERH